MTSLDASSRPPKPRRDDTGISNPPWRPTGGSLVSAITVLTPVKKSLRILRDASESVETPLRKDRVGSSQVKSPPFRPPGINTMPSRAVRVSTSLSGSAALNSLTSKSIRAPLSASASQRTSPLSSMDTLQTPASTSRRATPPSKKPSSASTSQITPSKSKQSSPQDISQSTPLPSLTVKTILASPQSKNKPPSPLSSNRRTNIPLPPELRDQIFTHLLTMYPSPIEYLPRHVRRQKDLYRRALNRPKSTRSPHQNALRATYFSLILTSKAVRVDATRMLFYLNDWFVRISLVRDLTPGGMPVFRGRNGPGELQATFGKGVLSCVRDFRVKVVCEDRRAEGKMEGFLGDLVRQLRESRALRKLVVEWANYYEVDGRAESIERREKIRFLRKDRRVEGAGGRSWPHGVECRPCEQDRKKWEREETILRPLLGLRGVPIVEVRGHVTEEWAVYLEKIMKGAEGPVEKFVRKRDMAYLDIVRT